MEYKVTKMRCLITVEGKTNHYEADVTFIDGVPYAVFEWTIFPDGSEKPKHLVSLDPNYLHPLPGWGDVTLMYEFPIHDPRLLS